MSGPATGQMRAARDGGKREPRCHIVEWLTDPAAWPFPRHCAPAQHSSLEASSTALLPRSNPRQQISPWSPLYLLGGGEGARPEGPLSSPLSLQFEMYDAEAEKSSALGRSS